MNNIILQALLSRASQLSVLRTLWLPSILFLATSTSHAYFISVDAATLVQRADVVAVVSIISIEPHYYNEDWYLDCGYTVTAKVSDAIKGADKEQIIQFGVGDPLKFRTSYLVALERSAEFDTDNTSILFDAEKESSGDEARERHENCIESLPDLKDIWRFRSEMIGSDWIPLGYKIYFAKEAEIEVIGLRISEVAIDRFGEDETNTTFERYDDKAIKPWTKSMLPEEVEYPQVYVKWDSYREYLVRATK